MTSGGDNVIRHEVGHLVDEISGHIDTKVLSDELKPLFHYGVEGRERQNKHTLPSHLGYSAAETPREYMAEAIRQYMGAPDAMKTVAPKTAMAIRKAVNSHPQLSPIIQFNANASPVTGLFAVQSDAQAKQSIADYLRSKK